MKKRVKKLLALLLTAGLLGATVPAYALDNKADDVSEADTQTEVRPDDAITDSEAPEEVTEETVPEAAPVEDAAEVTPEETTEAVELAESEEDAAVLTSEDNVFTCDAEVGQTTVKVEQSDLFEKLVDIAGNSTGRVFYLNKDSKKVVANLKAEIEVAEGEYTIGYTDLKNWRIKDTKKNVVIRFHKYGNYTITVSPSDFSDQVTTSAENGRYYTDNNYTITCESVDGYVVSSLKIGDTEKTLTNGSYTGIVDGNISVVYAEKSAFSRDLKDGYLSSEQLSELKTAIGSGELYVNDALLTEETQLADGEYSVKDAAGTELALLIVRVYHEYALTVLNADASNVTITDQTQAEADGKYFEDTEYTIHAEDLDEFKATGLTIGNDSYDFDDKGDYTGTIDGDIVVTYPGVMPVTVIPAENGTVEASKAYVMDGETFTFKAVPDEGFYLVSAEVNGEEVPFVNPLEGITVSEVTAEASAAVSAYEITAEFAEITATVVDGSILPSEARNKDEAAVLSAVLENVNPECLADVLTIEYKAGLTDLSWVSIDHVPSGFKEMTYHEFGKKSSETVRVKYGDKVLGSSIVYIAGVATTVEIKDSAEISYRYEVTWQSVLENIFKDVVVAEGEHEGEIITENPADVTLMQDNTKLDLTKQPDVGTYDVTIAYAGADDYEASKSEVVTITIKKAYGQISISSKIVNYGEDYTIDVSTNTKSYITIISGLTAEGEGYISLDLVDLGNTSQGAKLFFNLVKASIGSDGVQLDSFIGTIKNAASNPIIQAVVGEDVKQFLELISSLPETGLNAKVYLGQKPTDVGVYALAAITIDGNYTTAVDMGVLTILPNVFESSLVFNQELPDTIPYVEADNYDYTATMLYNDEPVDEQDKVQYRFVGVTLTGEGYNSTDHPTEPGTYVETAYSTSLHYWPTPIARTIVLTRYEADIALEWDVLEVEYDGEPHANSAYAYDVRTGEAVEPAVTLLYTGIETDLTPYFSENAPVNAGNYLVTATYAGSDMYQPKVKTARLRIFRADAASLEIPDIHTTYGDPLTVELVRENMINNGVVAKDAEVIINTIDCYGVKENVGSHTMTATAYKEIKKNYVVLSVKNGQHITDPRALTVVADDKTKIYGSEDPELTYEVTGTLPGERAIIRLEREPGENVGTYGINAFLEDVAYVLDTDAATQASVEEKTLNYVIASENPVGTFTIVKRPLTVTINDKSKVYGEEDPQLDYITENLVEGDEIGIKLVREAGENAGTYKITANIEAENSNYAYTIIDGTFTIKKRAITVKIVDKTKAYGEKDPVFEYTTDNLLKGDELNIKLVREAGEKVGQYKITANLENANKNYEYTVKDGTLTITANPTPAPGVKTGDTAPLTILVVTLVVAIGAVAVLIFARKRTRR